MKHWIADERARAGLTLTAPESEAGDTTSPGIPREEPGPREQEPQPQLQAAPPTMDIYHECAAESCDALVCNGGERQHMQPPYCSDACWYEHAKDGRVHGPADTKAWAEDTTSALWRRGRLTEVDVDPRSAGTLRAASGHQNRRSPVGPLSRAEARAGGGLPRPEGSGEQARSPGDDVSASVLWLPFTSSTSDLGDGGASTDHEHQQQCIQCHRHCKKWGDDGITTRRCACNCK